MRLSGMANRGVAINLKSFNESALLEDQQVQYEANQNDVTVDI